MSSPYRSTIAYRGKSFVSSCSVSSKSSKSLDEEEKKVLMKVLYSWKRPEQSLGEGKDESSEEKNSS